MSPTVWYILTAIALLIANGFFVAAQFALIAAPRSRIEHLADEGNARARIALRSVKEVSLMLAGSQLGITMTSLGLGFVAEPAVAHLLEAGLEKANVPSGVVHSISVVVA